MKKNIRQIFKNTFPKRKAESHKGDYGRIAFLAGSTGLTGAAVLAASGALRSGSGLVTVAVPASLNSILEIKLTEAMTWPVADGRSGYFRRIKKGRSSNVNDFIAFANRHDAIGIGPGLSRQEEAFQFVREALGKITVPYVLDADGLLAFEGKLVMLRRAGKEKILTPHPGEFDKLFKTKTPNTFSARRTAAIQAAKQVNAVVVLKGNKTVVASPQGEVYVNQTGNPGMATGGTGDVLTGIATAFLGFGMDKFRAACLSVFFHGKAGDVAAKYVGENALIASDLIKAIPETFQQLLGKTNA